MIKLHWLCKLKYMCRPCLDNATCLRSRGEISETFAESTYQLPLFSWHFFNITWLECPILTIDRTLCNLLCEAMEKLEVPSRRGPRELELDTPTFDDPLPGTWQKKWSKLKPTNIESNWVHKKKQQFQITANPQILDFKLQTLLLSKIPIQSSARVQYFLLGFEVHSLVSRCYKIYCELKKHMRGCSVVVHESEKKLKFSEM